MGRMATRRLLLGAMGAGLVVPGLVFAQAKRSVTVAVLYAGDSDDDEPSARPFFDQSRKAAHAKAARAVGLELVSAEFTNFEVIAKILAQFKRDGLIAAEITPSFTLIGRRFEVASLAARNGIALVAHRVEWAEAGAVLTYGVDVGESHRRAARIADRILKGAKPSDIPVERAQKFELAVNNRVATTLGLHISKPLLQRADRVIN